ncbi:MAG: RNA 2'-phosphotransferase [Lachnospiraceae bacterium]|nr:RNA 2'-phosphotransferase [Lachnospiraceae bacterium]MCM1240839.1 RNA 2'-phosphotransferase [Lachnospiraceae bacterium]
MKQLENLSKEISYALRHAPWEYELEMDETGRVPVEQLLEALRREVKWKNVGEADLSEIIEKSEKKRFEIKDGMIRAFYGHSIPMKILKEEKMPPDILYHGTARRFVPSIMENGLRPQNRQYVHLSEDVETAESVGKRHDARPCILTIDARRAWEKGIKFYVGNEKVWLADLVPGKYVQEAE